MDLTPYTTEDLYFAVLSLERWIDELTALIVEETEGDEFFTHGEVQKYAHAFTMQVLNEPGSRNVEYDRFMVELTKNMDSITTTDARKMAIASKKKVEENLPKRGLEISLVEKKVKNKEGDLFTKVSIGDITLKISDGPYQRAKRLCSKEGAEKEIAMIRLLLRYKILGIDVSNNFWSMNTTLYQDIPEQYPGIPKIEGFASPFNYNLETAQYCSLFIDDMKDFGALGPFNILMKHLKVKALICANPPYVPGVMADCMASLVEYVSEYDGVALVMLPLWPSTPAIKDYEKREYITRVDFGPGETTFRDFTKGDKELIPGGMSVTFMIVKSPYTDDDKDPLTEEYLRGLMSKALETYKKN